MTAVANVRQREKLLYTGKVHTTGGREQGVACSSDGALDVKLSPPGSGRPGTNPEQMLAAGWSACFEGAIGLAAQQLKIAQPVEPAMDAEVDLNFGEGGFFLRARLSVALPGLDREVAQRLVDEAHRTCPYSNALKAGIDITVNLV
jgi:Ohr subfamily peroxiredoxin